MSHLLESDGQSIGASASGSVLPMNIQDWFHLELTGLLSLQSKGLSRAFSTAVLKHQFFGAHPKNEVVAHMCVCVLCHFSRVWLFATPWTIAPEAPLSMGFSRQDYWSGLAFPTPGDLPNPGIQPESPVSPTLQVHSLPLSHQGKPQHMW